jgi:histidinol-phosphate/aromatic aminotransferase/cobyric acid decarboxylase-like protein
MACYHRFDQAFQITGPNLTAYTAAQPQTQDLNWYPDTGATHHVTSILNNLNLHSEAYDGPDEIQVGNGTRLDIQHTGNSKLSPNFYLCYALHVPNITKNLLSVQKFT